MDDHAEIDLELAPDGVRAGFWDVDLATRRVRLRGDLARTLGFDAARSPESTDESLDSAARDPRPPCRPACH